MDDIDKTVNDFRRALGMCDMQPRAYIFDDTPDKCQTLEDILWPKLEQYDIVHIPGNDDVITIQALFNKDLIVLADPLSSISSKLVVFARAQNKQLVMREKAFFEIKPFQP